MITPIGTNILVKKYFRNMKSKSGIVLTLNKEISDNVGIVIAYGEEVKNITINDKIVFEKYKGTELQHNDDQYFIVDKKDVLAKIND